MTPRFLRFQVVLAAVAALVLSVPLPASAATVGYSNPSCSSFSFTDLGGGSYSLRCVLTALPVCTIVPSTPTPATGTPLTLTADCAGNPFGWLWTGTATACSTTSKVCTDTQSVAGAKTYTVFAGNSVGQGPVASVTVNWSATTNPPTGCVVTRTIPSGGTLPQAGGNVQLNGACSGGGAITSWEWRKQGVPVAGQTAAQFVDALPANTGTSAITYSYEARACSGATNCSTWTTPPTTVSVSGNNVSLGFCSQYPKVLIIDLPWGGTVDTVDFAPGFEPDMVVVGRLAVPAGATSTSTAGQVRFVEYLGPTTPRVMNISTQACDFRGFVAGAPSQFDLTGGTYPMMWANGTTTAVVFQLHPSANSPVVAAGNTYYINLRNMNWVTGTQTCSATTCNGRFTIATPN